MVDAIHHSPSFRFSASSTATHSLTSRPPWAPWQPHHQRVVPFGAPVGPSSSQSCPERVTSSLEQVDIEDRTKEISLDRATLAHRWPTYSSVKIVPHPHSLVMTAPQAFSAIQTEIDAVPESALIPINLDIPRAVERGLGVANRMGEWLPFLAQLPFFDVRPVEGLHVYALAALHAHLMATEPVQGLTPLTELLVEAGPLREDLLLTAEILARRGLASAKQVAAIRSGLGHVDTANDLVALGELFDEAWSRIHDKVAVTKEMVDRAGALGIELHTALGVRQIDRTSSGPQTERRLTRAQAFTLFTKAYDACRRGMSFLRWGHGDVDDLVPSLYARRARRRGSGASDDPTDPPPDTTAAPTPSFVLVSS